MKNNLFHSLVINFNYKWVVLFSSCQRSLYVSIFSDDANDYDDAILEGK